MKKGIQILLVIVMVLSLGLSTMFAACAQETAPGAPTKISPQVPAQPATPVTPTTPATPAKPAPAPAAEVFKWRFQHNDAPGGLADVNMWPRFARLLEESTQGRMHITIYQPDTLVKSNEMLDGVGKGVIEMAQSAAGYWKGIMPWAMIEGSGPWFAKYGPLDCATLYWDYEFENGLVGLDQWIRPNYAEYGCYYVASMMWGDAGLIFAKPFESFDEMPNFIIRSHSGIAATFENLGAKTTYVPGGEVYMGLQLGTFDAASWGPTWSAFYSWKWYEPAKYVLEPFAQPGLVQILANMNAWNDLPDDIKAIFNLGIRDSQAYGQRLLLIEEGKIKQDMINNLGVKVIDMSALSEQNKFQAAAMKVLDTYAAENPKSKEVADLYKEYMRERGFLD